MMSAEHFRHFLQNELVRRCRANPRYSLRAFAKALDTNHAALSQILSGKRPLSTKMMRHLSMALGLGPTTPSPSDYQPLEHDAFQVIAEWHHFAILELTLVKGFRPEPRWMARALGLPVHEVSAAIERLLRLKLLTRTPKGALRLTGTGSNTTLTKDYTTTALRKLHRQLLEKAITALEETPLPLRDQSGMTLAIATAQLPLAKDMIKRFRHEFTTALEASRTRDAVYQLSISFFPLTPSERTRP